MRSSNIVCRLLSVKRAGLGATRLRLLRPHRKVPCSEENRRGQGIGADPGAIAWSRWRSLQYAEYGGKDVGDGDGAVEVEPEAGFTLGGDGIFCEDVCHGCGGLAFREGGVDAAEGILFRCYFLHDCVSVVS